MTLEMKINEELEKARDEGRIEGLNEGRTLEILHSVSEQDYSPERGAEKLGITVEELLEKLKEIK